MKTEGKEYLINSEYSIQFENIGDLLAYVLVTICQFYYFGTGKIVNGYFFPDKDSHFEEFFLPTILVLHLNLIVQHLVAFKITRQYVIIIIQTVRDSLQFYLILACFILSYFIFLTFT